MRLGRCQTGMKIEIVSMLTWDRYENHISFVLFPCLPLLFFYSALSSMCCSEAESATETGLKCICVHIHPALDSSRSEDSQLRPRLHETGTKSIRDDLVLVIVLFIIDVYMRPGWKMLRPVWSHPARWTELTIFRPGWIQSGMNVNTNTFQTGLSCALCFGTTHARQSPVKKQQWQAGE